MDAWSWANEEIKENLADDEWLHADTLRDFAAELARAFAMTGNRRLPLNITPETARYLETAQ